MADALDNRTVPTEAPWATSAVADLKERLDQLLDDIGPRVEAARRAGVLEGHETGFAAGQLEAETRLQGAFDAERESLVTRTVNETETRLRAEFDLTLESQEERVRLEVESRLRQEFALEAKRTERKLRKELAEAHQAELVTWRERHEVAGEEVSELQARLEAMRRELDQANERLAIMGTAAVASSDRPAPPAPEDAEAQRELAMLRSHKERLLADLQDAQVLGEQLTDELKALRTQLEELKAQHKKASRPTGDERMALDEAFARGLREGGVRSEAALKEAYDEGHQAGLRSRPEPAAADAPAAGGTLNAALDEARRASYEKGYEDGRGVGMARGKRQIEGEVTVKVQEASRAAYREGFQDGKKAGGDGERSWAFGVFHLQPGAKAGEIRQRYKRLSLAWHPDHNPGLDDDLIKNLNHARDILER